MTTEHKPHSELFTTVGVALDEYEYLWKLHASGIDIYERTHRLAVDALADLEEQYQATQQQFEQSEKIVLKRGQEIDRQMRRAESAEEEFEAYRRQVENHCSRPPGICYPAKER